MITSSDVRAAAARLAGHVRVTPLIEADRGAFPPAGRVWLKLEHLQHTGSFKVRGAFNRILSAAEQDMLPATGVVAASGGNAGLAVAYAAACYGLPARVYVPATAPPVKVARLREYGAAVVHEGDRYADAYEAAARHAAQTGALFCHAYDQPEICVGQGTLGLELLDQAGGQVDTVLIAVGGGGLMAGVAAATEGRARAAGVEPAAIPTLHAALASGRPVDVTVGGIAADSLGATRLGDIAYAVAARTNVRSVLVSDADIITARKYLWDKYRVAAEHGGAAALAALLTGAYQAAEGERIAVVVCGANTDPATLA
ncbi:MAG TPA: threonine/serine dehydratase [Streptosporangiaceae bacterium]|nr:threonine/serine dehydratase [Streptosporangiaceae bacterium]